MIDDLWYKNAVIYSLEPETFMDANGDGVGDFEGLVARLDYLQALGVDALWLAPFQPSPQKDNGYDISDHYGVDPRYGSSGSFVEFMHQAKRRGIKVLMDLVVNHTSDQHRWFKDARKSPGAKHHDWYIWSKERPKGWDKGMVFPGVQESTWTLEEKAGEYYFHRFYKFQPDLNMDHPDVREEVRRIMGYWLELGVAGFRLDAVPFVLETTSPGAELGTLQFEYLAEMRRFLQWRVGDAILLGEANVLPKEMQAYFGGDVGTGIHMMFNFYVNQYLFYALATSDVGPLAEALEATRGIPQTSQWAQFLRNHDELDLGRLTKKQREKVFARFGPEEHMQLYGRGIRRRLAPMLGERHHLELAYSVMFSLPGTPVIRQGDEIGMGDNLDLEERQAVRTPMQWSDEPNGGFSSAAKTTHPVISDGVYGFRYVNVAAQRRDPDSLLTWTAHLIRMRKECPEIGFGTWRILDVGCTTVLAMRYEWKDRRLITIHNFDERAQEIRLRPEDVGAAERLFDLCREEDATADEDGSYSLAVPAYGYHWYRPRGVDPVFHS